MKIVPEGVGSLHIDIFICVVIRLPVRLSIFAYQSPLQLSISVHLIARLNYCLLYFKFREFPFFKNHPV